jgi:hypothetical protein
LSTTNPTWIFPGVNPCLRGERPATNDLSHGTTPVNMLNIYHKVPLVLLHLHRNLSYYLTPLWFLANYLTPLWFLANYLYAMFISHCLYHIYLFPA